MIDESEPQLCEGSQYEILVNAAEGYKLKDKSLKISYVRDGKTVQEVIEASENGKYLFTMPAADVTISGIFVNGDGKTAAQVKADESSVSSVQGTGCLAVNVVSNNNTAAIRTSGLVHAGGSVNVHAIGNTDAVAIADAAGIEADPTPEDTKGEDTFDSYTVNNITVNETQNGRVVVAAGSLIDADTDSFTFTIASKQGFKLVDGKAVVTLTFKDENGEEQQVDVDAERLADTNDYKAVLNLSGMTDITAAISAQFEEDAHNIKISIDQDTQKGTVSADETANTGDTVTVTVTPDSGYKLQKLEIKIGDEKPKEITANEAGEFTFVMPSEDVTLMGIFEQKAYEMALSGDDAELSDTRANIGETATVSVKDADTTNISKFLKEATVTISGKAKNEKQTKTLAVVDGKFVIPEDIADWTEVEIAVTATIADKGFFIRRWRSGGC